MNILSILRLLRLPNVLIVFFTQYCMQYFVLLPGLDKYNLQAYLNHYEFFMLALCTAFITMGGNIINDLYDIEIDRINRGEKQVVGKDISVENTYRLYFVVTGIGAVIALFVAMQLGRFSLFMVYPLAVGLLWIYSRWFKRLPLSGNIIIAVFTACVCLVLLVPEWKNVITPGFRSSNYLLLLLGFSAFAAISNFTREVIKDLEDFRGDKEVGAYTLAVVLGITKARNLSLTMSLLILLLLIAWTVFFYLRDGASPFFWYSLFLISQGVYLIYTLYRANEKKDFHSASTILKVMMVSGLLYVFLI